MVHPGQMSIKEEIPPFWRIYIVEAVFFMSFTQGSLSNLKEQVNIVDVIGRAVQLQRKGDRAKPGAANAALRIRQDLIPQYADIIGNKHFFGKADREAPDAGGKLRRPGIHTE